MAFSISAIIKKVIHYRRDGETLYEEHPKTDGGQVALTVQNGVSNTNVQSELEAMHTILNGYQSALAGYQAQLIAGTARITALETWAVQNGYTLPS